MKAEVAARPGALLFLAIVLGIALATGVREAAFGALGLLLWIPNRWAWIAVGFAAGATLGRPPEPAPGRVWLDGEGVAVAVAMPETFGPGWRSEIRGPDGRRWMVKNGPEAALGEKVGVRGVGRPLTGRTTDLATRKGLAGAIDGKDIALLGGASRWAEVARDARRSYRDSLKALLPPRDVAFVQALGANLTADLDDKQRADLRTTGSIHLVSASGFHAGVLLQAGMLLLGFLPIGRGWQIAIGVLTLSMYATAVGLQAPIVRAGIMATLGLCAPLVRREPDALSAWGWSGALWLLFRPGDLGDLGFQLSYATLLAMILGGWGSSGLGWAGRTGFWAVLGSAPLAAYHFRGLPVYGIPANLLVEVAVPPILFFSVLGWALGGIPPVGAVSGWAMTTLSGGVQGVLGWIATWPGARIEIASFSPWYLGAIYGAMLALWRPRRRG